VRRQVRTVETLLGQGRAEEDRASTDEGLLLSPGPFETHRGPPTPLCRAFPPPRQHRSQWGGGFDKNGPDGNMPSRDTPTAWAPATNTPAGPPRQCPPPSPTFDQHRFLFFYHSPPELSCRIVINPIPALSASAQKKITAHFSLTPFGLSSSHFFDQTTSLLNHLDCLHCSYSQQAHGARPKPGMRALV